MFSEWSFSGTIFPKSLTFREGCFVEAVCSNIFSREEIFDVEAFLLGGNKFQ